MLDMGLPKISIIFKDKAVSALQRSGKGIGALIIKDDTETTKDIYEFTEVSQVNEGSFTIDNYNAIKDCFLGNPSKVIVFRIGTVDSLIDANNLLKQKQFNWLGAISDSTEQDDMVGLIKNMNGVRTKKIKYISYNANTTDDEHIINFANETVKRKADDVEIDGYKYIGRLVGLFAGLGINMSATYHVLDDLEYVTEISDVEEHINSGKLTLFNDEGKVRIARAITSLVNTTSQKTNDMKYIAIVEAMDMIYEDIKTTWKENYLGKYKNSYDNQAMFISAINSYFRRLGEEEILDPNYDNLSFVDVESQRSAWLSIGKTEAAGWDEAIVKNNTFRTNVFLGAKIKILNAMEDIEFNISMA